MTSSVPMIRPHLAWRLCCGAGLLIVLLTFVSSQQEPPRACGGLNPNYAPIIAFELARNDADLRALFGREDEPCRAQMIARMDAINWIDVLVFIPIYGAFLVFFFIGMQGRSELLARIGVKLALTAIVTDYVENLCLMQLTPRLDASSVWMALLPWATGAKWLALGAIAAVAGLMFASVKPRKLLIVGGPAAAICVLVLLVVIAALVQPASYGPMLSPAVGVSWLILLITAFISALRRPRD
jgi:hypothetical protein